jgi:PAS domain S-box-containing protein
VGAEASWEPASVTAALDRVAAAVLRTAPQPFLVLDAGLVVEAVNPAFLARFGGTAGEVRGRPLDQLGGGAWDSVELRRLLLEVLSERREVQGHRVEHVSPGGGRSVMVLDAGRIPRRDGDDLILLAISDVTEREHAIDELDAQKEFAEKVVDAVRDPLLVLDRDLTVRSANRPFYEQFGVRPAETEGRPVYEVGDGQWDIPELRRLLEHVLPANNAFDDSVVEHEFPGLGPRVMLLNARRADRRQLILLSIKDVTERRRSETRQTAVLGELQHRVKNILMNVRGLARQTRERSTDLDTFFGAFEGRLTSLARIQDLLVRGNTDTVRIEQILRLELGASGAREGETWSLAGPPVELSARVTQSMAMAAHELVTNAIKHGALAQAGGRIDVRWQVEREGASRRLRLDWRERGVALAGRPASSGFGMQIIERMLPYALGGTSELSFHGDGLECVIVVPLGEPVGGGGV